MKKIIIAILALISIGLIAVVFITTDERNKNTDKLTNFSNDFFGISFLYPEYLTSEQAETNFARYSKERVSFYEQRASGLLGSTVAFQIRLKYEKFNENEVFEYIFPVVKDKFKEVRPISLINSAKAATGPETVKIKDVYKITVGNNIFYTYAYIMDGERVDNFVIPQKFNSIIFTFYNQDAKFIKNILSSVKRIDGIYSLEGKQIIKNENIGLDEVHIPRNWLVTNNSTSTSVNYYSQDRNIEILITNFDTSQNSIAEKMENLDHGRGLTRLEQEKIEDSIGCGGINNWLYLNNDLSGCIIDNNNGFKAYYKVNNKKLFVYYNVVVPGKKNEIERIYLSEILDSIIVSGSDLLAEQDNLKNYINNKINISLKYPENIILKEPGADVILFNLINKNEYLQVQILESTPPSPEKYMPNGANFIESVVIDSKTADKYFTGSPLGEGVLDGGYPFTNYVVKVDNEEWIQIGYYGDGESREIFEAIIKSIRFN